MILQWLVELELALVVAGWLASCAGGREEEAYYPGRWLADRSRDCRPTRVTSLDPVSGSQGGQDSSRLFGSREFAVVNVSILKDN